MPTKRPERCGRARAIMLLTAALVSVCGVANADTLNTDDAIDLRRGAYALQGHYFSALKPMVTGKEAFDAGRAQRLLTRIDALLPMAFDLFPAGSDQGDTKARPEVWTQSDDFADKQRHTVGAVRALMDAAEAGDAASFKSAYFDAAASCKQCHDDYRRR
jgi:cytochrome c556